MVAYKNPFLGLIVQASQFNIVGSIVLLSRQGQTPSMEINFGNRPILGVLCIVWLTLFRRKHGQAVHMNDTLKHSD